MGRPGGGETPGRCGNHRFEGVAAERSVLLQVESDLGLLFGWQCSVQHLTPRLPALCRAVTKARPDRVFAESRGCALAEKAEQLDQRYEAGLSISRARAGLSSM